MLEGIMCIRGFISLEIKMNRLRVDGKIKEGERLDIKC